MPRISFLRLCHLLYVGAFCGLLAVPLLTHDWRRDPGVWDTEKRAAAPAPARPHAWPEVLAWPKQADAYLADHFGQRTAMVTAFNRTRWRLFGETPTEQTVFGGHGRLFLTTHYVERPYELIGDICGIGVTDAMLDQGAAELDAFLQQALASSPASYLMVVPTAPTLYPRDLPPWLREQCPPANTPANAPGNTMDRLLPRLTPLVRDRLLYPLPAMLAAAEPAIPRTDFHWEGAGAGAAAASFAEALHLPRRIDLPTRAQTEPSDLAHIIPGIPADNIVRLPDFAAVGAEDCRWSGCYAAWGEAASVIFDMSRVTSPRAGDGKLLIISNSFGHGIAGWFAPWFGSVWHFSVTFLSRLSPAQLNDFRNHVFREYRPDVVLYVFNDGSVRTWPAVAARSLWGR